MNPGAVCGERRVERLWRIMLAAFLAGGLLVLFVFGMWSWRYTHATLQAEIGGEAQLVADGIAARLTGLGDDLPYLGARLLAGPAAVRQFYDELKGYQDHHPDVASMVLFAPDGRMLLNTARPWDSHLPDPRRHPEFSDSIRATLRTAGIWIGKTQRGLVLGYWRIPVRYVIRDQQGKPLYILQASLPLDRLTRQWPGPGGLHKIAIGVIRPDGLHVARLPNPDPVRLFNTAMTGPLMQALKANPQATRGTYEGHVQSDFSERMGSYVRLRGFPLVAYISMSTRVVWRAWLRSTAPFFVLGLMGLAGYLVLAELMVRRERRHLDDLSVRARREPLTGLPNRLAVHEWLVRTLADDPVLGLVQLNLDDFNDINDALGGDAGDQVLQRVARRLQNMAPHGDVLVAHLGADEFLIGLPNLDATQVRETTRRMQRALAEPIDLGERSVRIQASAGIGLYPDDGRTPLDLLRAAATAVHVAKHSGRGQIAFYDPGASQQSEVRVAFNHAVERALTSNEFVLYYQPVVDMEDRSLVGAEALIRWQDPEQGLLPPARFIPLAEATGRIGAIGQWVVRQACRDLQGWQSELLELRISINVSAIQFDDPEFVDRLRRNLAAFGIGAGDLVLEVTETTLMQDVHRSAEVIGALADIGVQLAIDDFGTGYSSLSSLRSLPVQAIKIDRSFVSEIESDPEGLAIVRAVVALARVFGCVTVAEGVETESQYRILRSLGVHYGQGYWFGRPMPAADFRALALQGGGLGVATR